MSLKIYSAKIYEGNLKISVRSNGKISISPDVATALRIQAKTPILFAMDDDNGEFYMLIAENDSPEAFHTTQMGDYLIVESKRLMDAWNIDYADTNTIFDLIQIDNRFQVDGKAFRMIPRITPRTGARASAQNP